MTLKEAAAATGMLVKMTEATKLAGLDDPEVDVGPLTLLAPSDEAFNAFPRTSATSCWRRKTAPC